MVVRLLLVAILVVALAATASATPRGTDSRELKIVVLAPPAGLRDPGDVSEPHIALDPQNPATLVAVAQTSDVVAWRSEDGGSTWKASRPLAGKSRKSGYASGDPVIALGADGSALFAGVAIDRGAPCTLLNRVGSYRSTNGGRSFGSLAVASPTLPLPRHFFGVPPLPKCPIPKVTHIANNDKPWIAIDTASPRRGTAYLAWSVNDQRLDGTEFATLLVATSRDGGKTYRRPVVVAPKARSLEGLEQYSQIAVRPDGTVDLIWNARRGVRTVILHASSTNGGASFGVPERVYTLPAKTTPLGLVTSLAVSPSGRLAVCWSGSTREKAFVPRIGCSLSTAGGWSAAVTPFTDSRMQYLPAAAFEGERLWIASYEGSATSTRVVVASSDDGQTFGDSVVLAQRPYGRSRICAPHPPDCTPRQRFVGDYIGAVATTGTVWVDYVLPVAGATTPKRVYVATLPT